MLPVQQQQQGRESARTRVTGQHNERDMGCQFRQLLLQWYWMLRVCVSGCECVHKFVSAHFFFFSDFYIYIYNTQQQQIEIQPHSRIRSRPHMHMCTQRQPHWAYRGNACGTMSVTEVDAFNPETNLDFVLCVSSWVWASVPVYKARSRSH